MNKHRMTIIGLLFFLGFTIFLTLNRHTKHGIQNYHSEIWADKAGYYVYLPAFFIYHFQANAMPDSIAVKTGDGFKLYGGKIITKYPCGTALLLSPFFAVAHLLSTPLGYSSDGFSIPYHKAIDIAAVLYTFLALLLLYKFLVRCVSARSAFQCTMVLYLGTNVFYYSIFETGMSHIYSFFLFSLYLYLGPFALNSSQNRVYPILLGLVAGLIILVRPANILFLPLLFVFNSYPIAYLKSQYKSLFLMLLTAVLTTLPQLLYWHYAHQSYLFYSYGNEGFTHIFAPKFLPLWFAPNNGLFVYTPIVLLVLAALLYMFKINKTQSVLLGLFFMGISWFFAAWHDWTYGCSYGSRPYVEYFAVFTLPLAYFFEIKKTTFSNILLWTFIIVCIVINQKIMFTYDGCWYHSNWDWQGYLQLLTGPTK